MYEAEKRQLGHLSDGEHYTGTTYEPETVSQQIRQCSLVLEKLLRSLN